MNPEIINLYFNEDGSLEAARKYRFGTTGTSNFYPYDSYTIEGNTLICQYSKVESFFDEQSETGEHRYQLTSNGNLIADQEVWFRYNMFVRMRISNIPETGRDKRESCKSIL